MVVDNTVMIENARIIFKNFSGKKTQYNAEGGRNFAVLLDDDTAEAMLADGWNVKRLKPREDAEEDATPQAFIKVEVSYKGRPPRVVLVGSKIRTMLDKDTIEMVDYADIKFVDVVIRPYDWVVNGNSGRKAYLKTLFVNINEDPLELKYADMDANEV